MILREQNSTATYSNGRDEGSMGAASPKSWDEQDSIGKEGRGAAQGEEQPAEAQWWEGG